MVAQWKLDALARHRIDLMQLHYSTCEDFKQEKLDKVCKKPARNAVVSRKFWKTYIVDATPADPSVFVDNKSAQRQVEHFIIPRFCSKYKGFVWRLYVNGVAADGKVCCFSSKCNGSEPGINVPWPSDPARMIEAYLEVVKADTLEALRLGAAVEVVDTGFYHEQVALMEDGVAPTAIVACQPPPPPPGRVVSWIKEVGCKLFGYEY